MHLLRILWLAVALPWLWLAKKLRGGAPLQQRTIYFVRHQAAGVLYQYPFAAPPKPAQLRAIKVVLDQRHTRAPGKPKWWMQIVEARLLGASDLPALEPPGRPEPSGATGQLPQFRMKADAVVTPPKESA